MEEYKNITTFEELYNTCTAQSQTIWQNAQLRESETAENTVAGFRSIVKKSLDVFVLDRILGDPIIDHRAHQNVLGGIVNHAAHVVARGNLLLFGFLQKQLVAGEEVAYLIFQLRGAGLAACRRGFDELLLLGFAHELAVDGKRSGGRLDGADDQCGRCCAQTKHGFL